MDLREQILDTATQLFRTHGLNFTMQQVASSLHISKKTIYTVYPGKEALLTDMVDMLFAKIHQKKSELAAGTDPLEKRLYAVLTALPEEYAALDFRRLDELEEKYPAVAARVHFQLATGWEPTLYLLEQGIQEGCIRPVNLTVLQKTLTAAFEAILSCAEDDTTSYASDLEDMIDIVMHGLKGRDV